VNLSQESLAISDAAMQQPVGLARLRALCTSLKEQGCFGGIVGNVLATGVVGNASDSSYFVGEGPLPKAVLRAFGSPQEMILSAIQIALIQLLWILNFSGTTWMFLRALRRWSYGARGGFSALCLAAGWFVLASFIWPDLSILLFVVAAVRANTPLLPASR
jgi:hypothetical protein